MPLIVWDESYSVNVHLIDGQHKKLFDLANEYQTALTNGKSHDALKQLLDGLLNYAAIHFGTEERYFTQFGYDDMEAHKREHKIFNAKVSDIIKKRKIGEEVGQNEVTKFLKIWLEGHIKGTDHKYIELFNKNGLR
ncbi:MAG: bacteriohemerythrin [Bacteroidetes bacterium]|nr:bacteriohemerythrin [Bacteroidota bacterium]MBU1115139.1 bacteriohemerythrin [Bacteroidota bacterium]MBU1799278.1 bacteriohemerythrin [Bacteroidota bacterium]